MVSELGPEPPSAMSLQLAAVSPAHNLSSAAAFATRPMALPPAAPERKLKHRRNIDVQVFSRGNGLWEVDAHITDVKTRDAQLAGGIRKAGDPIHEMLLRLVVDEQFNVIEAGAQTFKMPYPDLCDQHGDAYGRLVGLNLLKGFRAAAKEVLGGVNGCTHITELCQVLPTAVLQAFVGEVRDSRENPASGKRPFQIDACHALRSDGEAVRLHYPRWYRAPQSAS
jgi:Protein of unknown function (DUF2889)